MAQHQRWVEQGMASEDGVETLGRNVNRIRACVRQPNGRHSAQKLGDPGLLIGGCA